MIKVILWDIDGTLLNFKMAEYESMKKCFAILRLGECTNEMIARYSKINHSYWERLERGEVTRPEVLVGRFRDFLASEGFDTAKAEQFNTEYQQQLGETVCFCDNGYELVKELKNHYKQYAVTNGTKVAQDKKLKNSGLIELFDDVFISEVIGIEKPNVGFFDHIWDTIGIYDKSEVMIVGDSLTSDIKGGNNAGILTCWYNPKGMKNDKEVHVDYEIRNLSEIPDILSLLK